MLNTVDIDHFNQTGQITLEFRLDNEFVAAIEAKMEALFAARSELDPDRNLVL